MKFKKLNILIVIGLCSIFTNGITFAENKNNTNEHPLRKALDSSDTLVGDAVKGTGNVIQATKRNVKNVGNSISNSVENNE